MHRSIPTLLTTAVAALPVGTAVAGTVNRAQPDQAALRIRKLLGPVVDMRWGPVQVEIVIRGRRLLDVLATVPIERPRSLIINQRAVPILRREALTAQSARIDVVSGATMTSEAYIQSLQSVLAKVHISAQVTKVQPPS